MTNNDENDYGNLKFDSCDIFKRNDNFLEVKDASDANGFKIPTEITAGLDASPRH